MKSAVVCLSIILLVNLSGGLNAELVSENCLQCLCQKLTSCNVDRGCAGKSCGPYTITLPFWLDAGSPKVLNPVMFTYEDSDFEACTNNVDCATKSIQNYMKLYERDCNKDGVIDCLDFAAIHKHGPFGCEANSNSPFVQSVGECVMPDGDSTISSMDWRNNIA